MPNQDAATRPEMGTIHVRVDPELKEQVDRILAEIGLGASEAIRIFYRQIVLQNGPRIEEKVPIAETKRAMRELAEGEGTRFEGAEKYVKAMTGL